MNILYFGDDRDAFKFDLLKDLCEKLELEQILYVPMLTSNYISTEGRVYSSKNEPFIDALFEQKKKAIENLINQELSEAEIIFENIKKNFKDSKIELVYRSKEKKLSFLQKKERDEYCDSYLEIVSKKEKQLIFFDPDNGFEPKKCTEKHIRYDEIKRFFDEMNNDSIIVVYQHRPLGVSWEDFKLKEDKFKSLTNCYVFKIDSKKIDSKSSDVAYFLIVKTKLEIDEYTFKHSISPIFSND